MSPCTDGVFQAFGRKKQVGSALVARAVVKVIAEQGGRAAQHADEHTWAACLSLLETRALPRA